MQEKNRGPLVSIIVNCFNGEVFLKDCLSSIINQNYQNWELIFWDNKSQDESAKIFKSYEDKRFKYFYSTKHTTLYEARNLAIENSKGEFISFLDTDDMWAQNKLDIQIPFFDNPRIGLVYSNLYIIKQNIKKKKLYIKNKLPSGEIYNDLIKNYNVGILTVVMRKFFYQKLKKKFDARFSIIGDFDLFLRLAKLCEFKSIQKPLAYYRLHTQNLSINSKNKEIEEFEIWLDENKEGLSEVNIQNLKKEINCKKFINSKIDGNYKKCFNILFSSRANFLDIKTFAIFLTPTIILKKLLWWHQK